jgi:threonine dehydratase
MITASDDDLICTMRFLWERMKIVVEPTATLGLAPIFNDHLDFKGKRVGIILSGGNVDLAYAAQLFSSIAA